MSLPFISKLIKSQTQPDGGEGYNGMATGYPVTVPGKEAAQLRQGTASACVFALGYATTRGAMNKN